MATLKHVRRGGRLSLILGAILATALFAGVAQADNVNDDVGLSVATTATITSGGARTVTYWIQENSAGGLQGCDASDGSPVTVTLNKPVNVTVSPSALTFNACGNSTTNTKSADFGSSALGAHSIPTVSVSDSSGQYNVGNTDFTLRVNPRPVASASAAQAGSDPAHAITVSWTASPDEAQLTQYSVTGANAGHVAGPSIHSTTFTGLTPETQYCFDVEAALVQIIDGTPSKFPSTLVNACSTTAGLDSTPPTITPHVTGTLGDNGWYVSDVSVTWDVSDDESTISSTSGCGPTLIQADTSGMTLTCSATSAGGTGSDSVTIRRDATKPVVSLSLLRNPDHNGWYNAAVGLLLSGSDATSGIASCDAAGIYSGPDNANASQTRSCTDNAGNTASDSVSFQYDATAPTINGAASPAANANGWNKTSVLVDYTCNDATSGVASCGPDETLAFEGANQSSSGTAVDNAGNSASDTVSGINIDKTNPNVSLNGGPADGGSYYFGFVPGAPSCDASDALSGLDGACSVSGYSNAIGTHTVIASASDKAGNSASVSRTYTVNPWTLRGFYAPVDMGASVVNTVKNGSTVPIKFEIFAGSNELTDTADVASLKQLQVNSSSFSGDPEDAIETTATGGTTLRYDTTAGQFVYNWKTPAQATKCYVVTMTTDDGSSLVAQFKLK